MLLKPRRTKQYKIHKNRLHGLNYNSKILTKGVYGLKALDYTRLTSKQIETSFIAINRIINKQARVYINVFPDISVTTKNIDSRMGKGKGDIKFWICAIKLVILMQQLPMLLYNMVLQNYEFEQKSFN